ncbi:MAG: transcription antitermination factor NusB [Verrucomicrobiales bacterium]|jgi:N utilization substance protein B|nr:transcription antitermination factor NusB [Verrucomicrobiales bacterium]
MGKRRDARLLAVQFLYQVEVGAKQDLDRSLLNFWDTTEAATALRKLAEPAIRGVLANYEELNAQITKYSHNWELKRIAAVDRNILRLALYEMLHCPDIPPVVSINEAIEIAKQLSTEESGRFVNGILDQIIKTLNRPARGDADGGRKNK